MEGAQEEGAIEDQSVGFYRGGPRRFYRNHRIRRAVVEEGVTVIEDDAFYDCRHLERIDLPESLREIGPFAFIHCESLAEVTFPSGLEVLNKYAFHDTNLKEINFPDTVRKIHDQCFAHCKNLKRVRLPQNSNLEIADYAFRNCKVLKDIDILDGIRAIRLGTFRESGLKRIKIPSSVKVIEQGAFHECRDLNDVIFAPGSSLAVIGADAFAHCSSLESIKLPSSLESTRTGAFKFCTNLLSIEMPVKEIAHGTFAACHSLFRIRRSCPLQKDDTAGSDDTNRIENWNSTIQRLNENLHFHNTRRGARRIWDMRKYSSLLIMDSEGFRGPRRFLPVELWPKWFGLINEHNKQVTRKPRVFTDARGNPDLGANLIFRQLQKHSDLFGEHCRSAKTMRNAGSRQAWNQTHWAKKKVNRKSR